GRDSEHSQERDKVTLLWLRQVQPLNQVEKLDGILESEATAVVEIGRTFLDSPQSETLDGTVARLALQESLHMQIVHLVVKIQRGRVADGAVGLAEEQLLATQLLFAGFVGV